VGLRVATWNVNSLNARLPLVEEWFAECSPDVVCMQETKLADEAFPYMAFGALGYEVAHHGEGRWNGVAIASRVGLDDVVAGFDDGDGDGEARILAATCGGVRVTSVYVPNGREVGHDQWHHKLAWMERLRKRAAADAAGPAPAIIGGDYNIAPDDRDVWDAAKVHGSTHVTHEERSALAAVLNEGYVDTFRRHHDEAGLFSWWDYQRGDFHKRRGMRIDLLLTTADLAERSSWALVDRNARYPSRKPSDHAPVVIEFDHGR